MIQDPTYLPYVLRAASSTDIGPREENQDHVYTGGPNAFVLADGMGGHRGGRMAAQIVCDSVAASAQLGPLTASLETAIRGANERLRAANTRMRLDAGSTMTLLTFHRDHVAVGWVGDSLAFRIRAGQIKLLNHPHNEPGKRWHLGAITEGQYRTSNGRHALSNCCGTFNSVCSPEVSRHSPALLGDVYVLLSDGAFDPMGTSGILEAIEGPAWLPLDQTAKALIRRAKRDEPLTDNATAVVVVPHPAR